ncbi:MAG: NAD(P)H-hydrate dehydratase [Candidatus Hydrogenedentales bacterium]
MAEEISRDIARHLLPARPEDGHKGTYGHLVVIGGARGFTGAVKMAALAGLRSGAGLVTAAIPATLGDLVAADTMEIMTRLLPATVEEAIARAALEPALEFVKNKDAVALGPGLSQAEETRHFVHDFMRDCSLPMVVDADGLNHLSTNLSVLRNMKTQCVLTPHPGEMARLAKTEIKNVQAAREKIAVRFAREHGCVLVLKGRATVVANADGECAVNTTGNGGLATGGTGDVLTGLIGGFLAQGMQPWDAARLGVYVHGLAGDYAAEAKTQRAMIAGDVIDCIPDAFRELESTNAR